MTRSFWLQVHVMFGVPVLVSPVALYMSLISWLRREATNRLGNESLS